MPESDKVPAPLANNTAPSLAAGRKDGAVQGAADLLRTTGPEARADSGSPVAAPATSPGQPSTQGPAEQVGRYRVHGEIGRGGMGVVLRSRDPELGRDLALKLMLG